MHPYPSVPPTGHYAPRPYPRISPHRQPYLPTGPPSSAYTHIGRDHYLRPPHGRDTYRPAYHPYAPPYKQDYHHLHHRLPPLPHPPAPPAPPAPYRQKRVLPRAQSSPMPTNMYYRVPAQDDGQRVPPRPRSSLGSTEASQNDEDYPCSGRIRLEGEPRARSDSLRSTYSSDVQENTPSPLDPEGIRLWEEQHAETRSRTESSGSGSYRDDDSVENGRDKVVIDPSLMSTSQLSHSYSSYGYDASGGSRWEEQRTATRSRTESSGSGPYRDNDDCVENGQGNVVIDPALMSASRSSLSSSSYGYDVNDSPVDDGSVGCDGAGDADDGAGDADDGADDGAEDVDRGTEDVDHEVAQTEMPYSEKRSNSEYYPSPHHQAQFADLASQRDKQGRIGLNSLVDGERGDRPSYPIPTIIKCAILGSPRERLTLSEIYAAMEERFLYYKHSNKNSWRNSVRHNLSLNNQFEKKPRPMTEPGKGNYWVVVPDMPLGNKRVRKRNKKPGKRALAAARAAEEARSAGEEPEASADTSTDLDKSGDSEVAVQPPVMPVHPAARPGTRIATTLPANAGSYAAVTGVIKMPEIDRESYRPWPGDHSSATSSIREDSSHESSRSSSVPGQDAQNQPQHSPSTADRPPGESLLTSGNALPRPASLSSESPRQQPRDEPAPEGGSSVGPQRTSPSRGSRLYNPIAAKPSPRSAFDTLADQLAREGTGAQGSGGPASRTHKALNRRRRPVTDGNESSGSGPSGDEEYLRSRIRGR